MLVVPFTSSEVGVTGEVNGTITWDIFLCAATFSDFLLQCKCWMSHVMCESFMELRRFSTLEVELQQPTNRIAQDRTTFRKKGAEDLSSLICIQFSANAVDVRDFAVEVWVHVQSCRFCKHVGFQFYVYGSFLYFRFGRNLETLICPKLCVV